MTVTAATLRQAFPEFADGSVYPNAQIDLWITFADTMIDQTARWGAAIDMGKMLMVCHNLVLSRRAVVEAANGAPPGGVVGPVNNKSVDKVSVGYDLGAVMELKAGHWSLTTYGVRFVQLSRLIGSGPIQTGPGAGPSYGSSTAWPGPWPWNFPSPNN